MHTSNQRGRGNDPVVVLGKIKSLVAVNIYSPKFAQQFSIRNANGRLHPVSLLSPML